mmetsp:Transcript_27424/g.59959  ORF Transcript_27424/g.59959 Transcript_27424/m.59959 type:complete len:245 (+) Transcript_27424:625-1359(+)
MPALVSPHDADPRRRLPVEVHNCCKLRRSGRRRGAGGVQKVQEAGLQDMRSWSRQVHGVHGWLHSRRGRLQVYFRTRVDSGLHHHCHSGHFDLGMVHFSADPSDHQLGSSTGRSGEPMADVSSRLPPGPLVVPSHIQPAGHSVGRQQTYWRHCPHAAVQLPVCHPRLDRASPCWLGHHGLGHGPGALYAGHVRSGQTSGHVPCREVGVHDAGHVEGREIGLHNFALCYNHGRSCPFRNPPASTV